MKTDIDNTRFQQIQTLACMKLREALFDGEKQILKDFADAVDAAHENGDEKFPKLKLSFAIALDVDANELTCDLKWTAPRSISDVVKLDDPNQPELFDEKTP